MCDQPETILHLILGMWVAQANLGRPAWNQGCRPRLYFDPGLDGEAAHKANSTRGEKRNSMEYHSRYVLGYLEDEMFESFLRQTPEPKG